MKRAMKLVIHNDSVSCPVWARTQAASECFGCSRFLAKSEKVLACAEEIPGVTVLAKLRAMKRARAAG